MSGTEDENEERKADRGREIRMLLHGVRNPLAAGRLEVQLARRASNSLQDALDAGDTVQAKGLVAALNEAILGVDECLLEICSRLDNAETSNS